MNSFILGKDIEIMSHFLRLFEGETASTARQDPGARLRYLLKKCIRGILNYLGTI